MPLNLSLPRELDAAGFLRIVPRKNPYDGIQSYDIRFCDRDKRIEIETSILRDRSRRYNTLYNCIMDHPMDQSTEDLVKMYSTEDHWILAGDMSDHEKTTLNNLMLSFYGQFEAPSNFNRWEIMKYLDREFGLMFRIVRKDWPIPTLKPTLVEVWDHIILCMSLEKEKEVEERAKWGQSQQEHLPCG